jgi:ribA/ribD-fused uncharacterized protein
MIPRIYPLEGYAKFFSTFSAHAVEFEGVLYPTVEHAYHCQRYADEAVREEIRSARSAIEAWGVSQKYKSKQQTDFDERKAGIMEALCRAKLIQHDDVKQALIESGADVIVKNFPDSFWGIGNDGTGGNMMGQIWIKLRSEVS